MEEKKLTDEEIVEALDKCREKTYCEEKCEYRLAEMGSACIPKLMGQALDLIHRLQKEKEQQGAAVKLHVRDIDDLHAVELNRENEQLVKEKRLPKDMNAELQEQATKIYNKGFDRGVKAAVDKMRAYLPPRDVDRYPDAVPQHWQLDEVLRQLIGNK